jgi:hypothetical protein
MDPTLSNTSVQGLTASGNTWLSNTAITGKTDINVTGNATTTIGSSTSATNVSGTLTVVGLTKINETGAGTTTIGNSTAGTVMGGQLNVAGDLTVSNRLNCKLLPTYLDNLSPISGTDISSTLRKAFTSDGITGTGPYTYTSSSTTGNVTSGKININYTVLKNVAYKVCIRLNAVTTDLNLYFDDAGLAGNVTFFDFGIINTTKSAYTFAFISPVTATLYLTIYRNTTSPVSIIYDHFSIEPIYETNMNSLNVNRAINVTGSVEMKGTTNINTTGTENTTIGKSGGGTTALNNAATTVGGTLGVTGLATLSGGATVTGTTNINATGSGTTIIGSSSSATTALNSVATTVGGTLSVTGLATFSGGATVTGATKINETGSGTTIIGSSSSATTALNSAATTVGGTLGVTGLATLSGGISTGTITIPDIGTIWSYTGTLPDRRIVINPNTNNTSGTGQLELGRTYGLYNLPIAGTNDGGFSFRTTNQNYSDGSYLMQIQNMPGNTITDPPGSYTGTNIASQLTADGTGTRSGPVSGEYTLTSKNIGTELFLYTNTPIVPYQIYKATFTVHAPSSNTTPLEIDFTDDFGNITGTMGIVGSSYKTYTFYFSRLRSSNNIYIRFISTNVARTIKFNFFSLETVSSYCTTANSLYAGTLGARTGLINTNTSSTAVFKIESTTAAGATQLWLKPYANSNWIVDFQNVEGGNRGQIAGVNSNTISFNATSDRRLKTNIKPMSPMIDKIMALKPSEYNWTSNEDIGYGFIAQEAFELFPEMRCKTSNSCCNLDEPTNIETGEPIYYGIDYGKFTPYIVKAVQEMKQDYDNKLLSLEERINALEGSKSINTQSEPTTEPTSEPTTELS